jgi:hypothetical protein
VKCWSLSRSWTEQTVTGRDDAHILQELAATCVWHSATGSSAKRWSHVRPDHAMLQTDIEIVTRDGHARTWTLNASSPGALKDGRATWWRWRWTSPSASVPRP